MRKKLVIDGWKHFFIRRKLLKKFNKSIYALGTLI